MAACVGTGIVNTTTPLAGVPDKRLVDAVAEARQLLRHNGYDFSDLSEQQLDQMSKAIAHSLLRNKQQGEKCQVWHVKCFVHNMNFCFASSS